MQNKTLKDFEKGIWLHGFITGLSFQTTASTCIGYSDSSWVEDKYISTYLINDLKREVVTMSSNLENRLDRLEEKIDNRFDKLQEDLRLLTRLDERIEGISSSLAKIEEKISDKEKRKWTVIIALLAWVPGIISIIIQLINK